MLITGVNGFRWSEYTASSAVMLVTLALWMNVFDLPVLGARARARTVLSH